MGFSNLFKQKKKKQPQEDFNILSAKGLINYVKSNIDDPSEKNVLKAVQEIAQPDKDQDHLTEEGELPWGWRTVHKPFVDKISGEYKIYLDLWLESRNKSPFEQHAALKQFVQFMNDTRKLCESKGECHLEWFKDCATDDYIKARSDELAKLEANLENSQAQYALRKSMIRSLDNEIMNKLRENDGILQSEFVKMFDPVVQKDVSEKLYYMSNEKKLIRTKSGRSYKLHLK